MWEHIVHRSIKNIRYSLAPNTPPNPPTHSTTDTVLHPSQMKLEYEQISTCLDMGQPPLPALSATP